MATEEQAPSPPVRSGVRTTVMIVTVVCALAVVAVALFVKFRSGAVTDAPEKIASRFVQALHTGDARASWTLLAGGNRGLIGRESWLQMSKVVGAFSPGPKAEFRVKDTELQGDKAVVKAEWAAQPIEFQMVREDGAWKVDWLATSSRIPGGGG